MSAAKQSGGIFELLLETLRCSLRETKNEDIQIAKRRRSGGIRGRRVRSTFKHFLYLASALDRLTASSKHRLVILLYY